MTQIIDGFERGFAPFGGVGELTVPEGWTPAWVQGTEEGVLVRPEFKPAGAPQVRSGLGAVAIHSSYATIDGAIYRQFETPRGTTVTVHVWMMKEAPEDGHSMRVGIDPTGGVQFTSTAVVWSEWYSQYSADWLAKEWRDRVVETTAASNMITVYLHSKVDIATEGSHAHFDDLTLEYQAGTPQPPPATGTGPVVRLYVDERLVWEGAVRAGVDARVPTLLNEAIAKTQEARSLI